MRPAKSSHSQLLKLHIKDKSKLNYLLCRKDMQTLANSNKQTTRSNVVYILFIFILYATIRLDSAKWVAVLQFSNPPGLELFIDFVQLALLMSKVLEEFHITGGHRAPSNCLCQVIHHDSRIHRGSPLASLSFYP